MKRSLLHMALTLSVLFCVAAGASAGATGVWAVNDGEKVMRDDLSNPNKARNSAWDGKKVTLFAARNEIVAFQIIVQADDKGIERLAVSFPSLESRNGSGRIAYSPPAPDPTVYLGRDISVFSVNYMQVTRPSKARWVFPPDSASAPDGFIGWVPVQLVPENARAGRGGFPLTVKPETNQAVWIEVYTSKDLEAGLYEGVVSVAVDGETTDIPVELEVLAFTLPDENSLPAMVYFEPYQTELYQGKNLTEVYHRFAHRQRVELVGRYSIDSVRAQMGRFSGEDFTSANGYDGPGAGTGNRIVPVSFYGPLSLYTDRSAAHSHSDEWMTFLDETIPGSITFMYMPDEPRPDKFALINQIAANIHSNEGPGKRLPVLATTGPREELAGSIDIWCVGVGHYDIEKALKERADGREVWVYNGGRPGGGAVIIDSPATDSREIPWACFKHGIEGYFYWHGDHWRHNSQIQGPRIQNVWANPITFNNVGQANRSQGGINGDGVLMYPGQEVLHPEEDRGVPGPCSTLQMANLRRGLQDHLYLTMARELGLDKAVDEALGAVVPKVFSEVDRTGPVHFAETGDQYEAARRVLAVEIVKALSSEDAAQ